MESASKTLDSNDVFDVESGYSVSDIRDAKTIDDGRGNTLSWSNINVTLNKKGQECRRILQNVCGEAIPGKPTAILGPSGAGKTTLFSVLTGRIGSANTGLKMEKGGEVLLGGRRISRKMIRRKIAFVPQEDALPVSSTPREAIRFSARLRLPRATTAEEIEKLTDACLNDLGLSACADTVIGSGLKKGLSGGEKKRTSIGIELVVNPPIIMLDEPTSGLDSFSAAQVIRVLNSVAAKANTTVLFTVHQPSSEVFDSIPRYIVMNRGRVLCHGLTQDISSDFEHKHGYPVPNQYNPADFIIAMAQKENDDTLVKHGFYSEGTVTNEVPNGGEGQDLKLTVPATADKKTCDHVSTWTELRMLMVREKNNLLRCTEPMVTNVSVTLALALVYGIFFWKVGSLDRTNETNVQAIQGTLQNIQISTMLSQHSYALMTLPTERPLFLREYSTGHYSTIPYFLSKLTAEAIQTFVAILVQSIVTYFMIGFQLPFMIFFTVNFGLAMTVTAIAVLIGASVSNLSSVTDLYALATVPQFFFSGVFAPIDVIPAFVRWAQYLCSLKYAAGLAMIYEFKDCGGDLAQRNCDTLLERNDVQQEDEWWYWLAMLGLFCSFRLLALMAIKRRASIHA